MFDIKDLANRFMLKFTTYFSETGYSAPTRYPQGNYPENQDANVEEVRVLKSELKPGDVPIRFEGNYAIVKQIKERPYVRRREISKDTRDQLGLEDNKFPWNDGKGNEEGYEIYHGSDYEMKRERKTIRILRGEYRKIYPGGSQ